MFAWGERWNKTESKILDLKWLFYIPRSVTWKKEHVWLLPCVIELKGKEKSEDRRNFTQRHESLNSGVEFISFRNRLLFFFLTSISVLWKSIKDSRQMKEVCSQQGIVQGGGVWYSWKTRPATRITPRTSSNWGQQRFLYCLPVKSLYCQKYNIFEHFCFNTLCRVQSLTTGKGPEKRDYGLAPCKLFPASSSPLFCSTRGLKLVFCKTLRFGRLSS